MAWTRQQIIKLQIYRRAAALSDGDYRALLKDAAGVTSSTHPAATQHGYDQVMARVEAVLDYRVQEALVPRPDPRVLPDLNYWRRRIASSAGGGLSTRQLFAVRNLWTALVPHLPGHERTDAYLLGIARRACDSDVESVYHLRTWQAAMLIDALKDRLRYAIRNATTAPL